MASTVQVSIHPTQFPDRVQKDLVECLQHKELNHKFLYEGWKQTQKWLALHQACSPSRTDSDCAAIYDEAFKSAANKLGRSEVALVGLGCGGGQKDTRCIRALAAAGKQTSYTAVDVSTPMVLTAREYACNAFPGLVCAPFACDLGTATDLPASLEALCAGASTRLVTFFGMMPNFNPEVILPKLAQLVRPGDLLLLSANLAPGPDYAHGVAKVLTLYDNEPTREWLWTFLRDIGLEPADGELAFGIEDRASGLKRIVARFRFRRVRTLQVQGQRILFDADDSLLVFFSYRHTPSLIRTLLLRHNLRVIEEWVSSAQEEGVFLVERAV